MPSREDENRLIFKSQECSEAFCNEDKKPFTLSSTCKQKNLSFGDNHSSISVYLKKSSVNEYSHVSMS